MYFTKVPKVAKYIFPKAIWSSIDDPKLLLTFDDGPHPDSTPELLACLAKRQLKATFFCSGSQATKHPDLMNDILSAGHAIGYHGFAHLNGWKTSTSIYLKDLEKNILCYSSKIFRPAFGKLSRSQYSAINAKHVLDIVFWTHMPGDFDNEVTKEVLTQRVSKAYSRGNIIVLHDKPHCISKVCYALSRIQL